MCCRCLLPTSLQIAFLPVPNSFLDSADPQSSAMQSTSSDLLELTKVLAYRLLLTLRPRPRNDRASI
jgi:hypothetical protein